MPEREKPEPKKIFDVSVFETAVSVKCDLCDMPGLQRLTVISYIPTMEGRFINFSKEPEMLYGNISWERDHSGCPGNMRINL